MAGMGPFDLTGKNAVVTGGAMGIGFGIVNRLVEGGANVLIADMDLEAAEAACGKLESNVCRTIAMKANVTAKDAGEAIVNKCVEEFGSIDILVNNAGVYPQLPVLDMTEEIFDKVLNINLKGLFFISKAGAAKMVEQGKGGKIINIASIDAIHPSMVGLAAYDASKGGVLMFTKNLALELGPKGINVNAIAPGGITTEGTAKPLEGSGMSEEEMKAMMDAFAARIPMGRMGVPDDIGKVALFLASSAADYMTGEVVVVDGGMLLS